jgi:Trehalase
MPMRVEISRRTTLKLLFLSPTMACPIGASQTEALRTATKPELLTATLSWDYPNKRVHDSLLPFSGVHLRISPHQDMADPVLDIKLPEHVTSFRLAVAPESTYYWLVVPFDSDGEASTRMSQGRFVTGKPLMKSTENDEIRYRNPRIGAHWEVGKEHKVIPFALTEPLSPWFRKKSYRETSPPKFEDIKSQLPVPVLETNATYLDAYWYSWKTLLETWCFAPSAYDHEAVSNLIGIRTWGNWGSTMVWDTAFILHFARYGHGAYPFITSLDNCYARQHENGFICRESDRENREVYAGFPLNPALFSWAEWEYFQLSNDEARLRDVLVPITRHYEWWMKYQRRPNGWYWTDGFNEADDSPRNGLMYYAASATSYQALAALYLAKMAHKVGRSDLNDFFLSEHSTLGRLVNQHFWDAPHSLYNDRTKDGRFITELEPGVFCKHAHMFWPLLAEIADSKGVEGLVRELRNPNSFYRSSGVPSLSADSRGYREDGQYWKGSVWPPVQCIVQEGLRVTGHWNLAQDIAQKYTKAVLDAYSTERTITENLAPDKPKGYGVKDFVGWGGIGPISNLLEFIIGLHVNAPDRMIEWRIGRTDRHGVTNLKVGHATLSLICDGRRSPADTCHIAADSDAELTLKVHRQDQATVHRLERGHNQITVA